LENESITGRFSLIFSGSSYETTTIDGLSSDIDSMYTPNQICVIDNIDQWRPDTSVQMYMMDSTRCYKGFF